MKGWIGKILWVDLSSGKTQVQAYDGNFAHNYVGGRGFAARILWDHVPAGTDPFSPQNLVVFAAGPLNGLPGPSTGKLVVATKSPLTHGYGDGNIGTRAALEMRRSGFDAVIVKGKAEKPVYLYVERGRAEILSAEDIWGLDTFTAERKLLEKHGKTSGVLVIGPAGERLISYATVMSQEGRSGGRVGAGAVMGSKRLKAVVFSGGGEVEAADPDTLRRLAAESYKEIKRKPQYGFWMRQGTMMTIQWSQENSVLPTFNFNEGVFEESGSIDGYAMEKIKKGQRGCPNCNMTCGNFVLDDEKKVSELDYENVAMLGSNLGIGDLEKVARLNRLSDMWGVDTINLGAVLGYAVEASQNGLLAERIEWGDFKRILELAHNIVERVGEGDILAEGLYAASLKLGGGDFAMHVKGLSISAYDCHAAPGMALSYGVSPIGAHHKDAWIISWEVSHGRFEYSSEKAARVVELQRIRGGFFETLVACRLPWVEVGLELDWYLRIFNAATGLSWSLQDHIRVADRIHNLIRAFWVREYTAEGRGWSRLLDYPPAKWFKKPLTAGPYKGARLDPMKYDELLGYYYSLRGWDFRGVPRASTLDALGLRDVRNELEKYVSLMP